jgi:hypothetical protein
VVLVIQRLRPLIGLSVEPKLIKLFNHRHPLSYNRFGVSPAPRMQVFLVLRRRVLANKGTKDETFRESSIRDYLFVA